MNNLEPVAWHHRSGNPQRPRKNFEIALNGDAVRRQTQMREQAGYTKPSGNFSRFSIHDNLNACGHFTDDAGTFPSFRALSRKRSSACRSPSAARITRAVPSGTAEGI